MADASAVTNRLLAQADNRQLALNLAGAAERPVVFFERVRVAEGTGLGALPGEWKFAFLGLLVAGLLFIWSRIRRLGAVPEAPRLSAPPRRRYVVALADSLAAASSPSVGENLRGRARALVARRAGLGPDADEEQFGTAARRVGLDDETVEVLRHPVSTEDDLKQAAAAVAILGDSRG